MWAQWVSVAVGLWLMAAPGIFSYAGTPAGAQHRIVGPLIVSFSFVAAWAILRSLRWFNAFAGAWLLTAPLLGDFPAVAILHSILGGLVMLALAPVGGLREDRFAGGWATAVRPERLDHEERA